MSKKKSVQIAGIKLHFWVGLWGCFPKRLEISIWVSRLNTERRSPFNQCEHTLSSLRAQIEQTGRGKVNSLSLWAGTSIFSCPWISKLLVLRSLDCGTYTRPPPTPARSLPPLHSIPPSSQALFNWIIPRVLLVLQLVNSSLFSLHNFVSQFLKLTLIFIFNILLVLFLGRTMNNTISKP